MCKYIAPSPSPSITIAIIINAIHRRSQGGCGGCNCTPQPNVKKKKLVHKCQSFLITFSRDLFTPLPIDPKSSSTPPNVALPLGVCYTPIAHTHAPQFCTPKTNSTDVEVRNQSYYTSSDFRETCHQNAVECIQPTLVDLTEPLLYFFIKNLRITLILSAISNTLVAFYLGFWTFPIPKISI